MASLSSNIFLVIAVTSIATYLSRSLGVLSSEKIDENSKIFRLFDCIAYSTLAALISKVVIFPAGDLNEADVFLRLGVVFLCVGLWTQQTSLISFCRGKSFKIDLRCYLGELIRSSFSG